MQQVNSSILFNINYYTIELKSKNSEKFSLYSDDEKSNSDFKYIFV